MGNIEDHAHTFITFETKMDIEQVKALGPVQVEYYRQRLQLGLRRAGDVIRGALSEASRKGPLNAGTGLLGRSWKVGSPARTEYGASLRIVTSAVNPPAGSGITAGSPVPYARIHEDGGTIHAKAGGKLTIPILDNVNKASGGKTGAPRYASVASLRSQFGKNVFTFKSKAGNLIVGTADGKKKNGGLRAWFVLKDSVVIPASHYITHALKEGAPGAAREISEALDVKF